MSLIRSNALAGASGQGGGGGYEIERSLRFNSGDSANLSRTPTSAGSSNTFTFSFWVKRTGLGTSNRRVFGNAVSSVQFNIMFDSSDRLYIQGGLHPDTFALITERVFSDPSAWYHFVISFDKTASTTVRIYCNGSEITTFSTSDYPTSTDSFSWNAAGAHYIGTLDGTNGNWDGMLAEVHFIDGQALAATDFGEYDTNNVWQPKKFSGTYGTNGFKLDFSDTSSNAALGTDTSGNSNTWTVNNLNTLGNDHIYTNAVTTTEGGGSFYSGVAANLFSAGTHLLGGYSSSDHDSNIIWTPPGGIAVNNPKITAEYYTKIEINGTTVASETTGGSHAEQTLSFVGTLNTLLIENTDGLGSVVRAHGLKPDGTNLVTVVAGDLGDVFRDSPTNGDPTNDTGVGGEVVGNYCTWNPLGELTGGYVRTLTDGNLTAGGNGDSIGTITFGSGKTYFELTVTSASGFSQGYYGIVDTKKEGNRAWSDPFIAAFRDTGALYGTSSTGSAPAAAAVGTIYGIAVDVDNQKMFISVNGTWLNSGNPASGTGASFTGRDFSDYAPLASLNSSDAQTITLNTGQRPFASTAPSGYKCLCTANLPDPTIEDGSTAFDTKLWTGNGGTMDVTGLNNSPDLVWYKSRSATGYHFLVDTIRGVNKSLHSNATDAELSQTGLTSFNSDGYTLGPNTTIGNTNGESYVGWSWDAGSSNTSVAAGGLNSSLYDQSQTWSGLDTWPTAAYSTTPSHAFNGVASANTADIWYSDAASTVTLTNLAAQLPNPVTTLEVYTFDRTGTITITVNGTAHAFPNVGDYAWNTVNVNAQITSLTIAGTDSSYWGIGSIKVNGKILADSGVTPPNLPSIASTVRANPSAGFSIVSYTGDGAAGTIAHNLNAKPDFVITKNRTTANYWAVWHSSLTANKFLRLDLDNAEDTESNYWTDFDSNVVHVPGSGSALNNVNNSSKEYISYCFAPVEGYSAFGSYVGNGSSSGPFVYTGFKTRWVMMKKSSGAGSWVMYDTTRDTAGSGEGWLYANSNSSEQAAATYAIHTTSNGFRMAGTSGENNGSGATYIYAAFAEHPFKTARAR